MGPKSDVSVQDFEIHKFRKGTRMRVRIPFGARVWHRKKSEAPSAAVAAPQRGTAHASRRPAGRSGCSRSADYTNGRTLLPSSLGGCVVTQGPRAAPTPDATLRVPKIVP